MFPSGQVQQHRQEFADATLWVSAPEKKAVLEKSNAKKKVELELQKKTCLCYPLFERVQCTGSRKMMKHDNHNWFSLLFNFSLSKWKILKVPNRSTISHQLPAIVALWTLGGGWPLHAFASHGTTALPWVGCQHLHFQWSGHHYGALILFDNWIQLASIF